jgi:hypothetical protein
MPEVKKRPRLLEEEASRIAHKDAPASYHSDTSGRSTMDAQRSRRTRDEARKAWYAYYRQVRFARWFGFIEPDADLNLLLRNPTTQHQSPPGLRLDGPAPAAEWSEPALWLQ